MRSRKHILPTVLGNMTNNIVTVDQTRSPFDSIRRFDENGKEYWIARELMKLLGYTKWERFGAKETQINRTSVIKKAIAACRNAGSSPDEHFNHFPTWGNTPENWFLTRYACYLIAQNGDPEKPEIAAAQSYFAIYVFSVYIFLMCINVLFGPIFFCRRVYLWLNPEKEDR